MKFRKDNMSWFGSMIDTVQKWSRDTLKSSVTFKGNSPQREPVKKERPNFQSMTKKQLEEYGRTVGVEFYRRQNKAKLIARLEKEIP